MAEIRIEIDDTAVLRAIADAGSRLKNLRPVMKEIGEYMLLQTDDRFRNQTDPDGNPWKPVTRRWREQKQRMGKIDKTLQMRGRLRKSITYRAEADQVAIGTNVKYAPIHQFGGSIVHYAKSRQAYFRVSRDGSSRFAKKSRANFARSITIREYISQMPARPFLGVNSSEERTIEQMIVEYLSNLP